MTSVSIIPLLGRPFDKGSAIEKDDREKRDYRIHHVSVGDNVNPRGSQTAVVVGS